MWGKVYIKHWTTERKRWKEEQETTYFLKIFWHLNFEFPPFQLQHYHNIYFSMEVISWDMIWKKVIRLWVLISPGNDMCCVFTASFEFNPVENESYENNRWIDHFCWLFFELFIMVSLLVSGSGSLEENYRFNLSYYFTTLYFLKLKVYFLGFSVSVLLS